MECEYKEFLLCDLCPKVRECKSDCRVVSNKYALNEFINKVTVKEYSFQKAMVKRLNEKYGRLKL